MSSTRYANGGELRQNRWASDPLFVESRGIQGLAVAAKASLLHGAKQRSLLYFLQSRSMEAGGLKKVARELVEMFPEKLVPKESIFSAEERLEMASDHAKAQLPEYLAELCVNPHIEILMPGYDEIRLEIQRRDIAEKLGEESSPFLFKCARVDYFRGLVGALFEYQERYEKQARERFVMTSVAKQVWEALDYCLRVGKMVLLEGNSGVGKTEAIKAWFDAHRGEARIVSMTSFNNRTCFISELARVLGVACGNGYSPSKAQAKAEAFLERSKLMLVVDEAQYAWPMSGRITQHRQPELINWFNTALYNRGVPVAMVATKEFARRRAMIESQTNWSSEQLSRRVRRCFQLPEVPSHEDLEAVARRVMPGGTAAMVKLVVAYAVASKRYMTGIKDLLDDARLLAEDRGEAAITLEHLKEAALSIRAESDAAQQRVFEPVQRRGKAGAAALQAPCHLPAPDRRETCPGQSLDGPKTNFTEQAETRMADPAASQPRFGGSGRIQADSLSDLVSSGK